MTHTPPNAGNVTFMDVQSDISEGALQDKSDTASRVTKRKSPDDIVFHVPRTCMERVIRDILFMQSGGQEFRAVTTLPHGIRCIVNCRPTLAAASHGISLNGACV